MSERELIRQDQELLRGIIRSIDKKLDYSFIDQAHEGRFSLRLSSRGRERTVSLSVDDLKLAGQNPVLKNTIRQKIKSTRDHMLATYVADVMGKQVTKMLKRSETQEQDRPSFFRRAPRRR